MAIAIYIPKKIAEKIRDLGLDLETFIIELIAEKLGLDPFEEARIHLELADQFLEEGKKLIDSDPVQASEKLYKAAEECVKALTLWFKLEDVLKSVRSRGRWTVTELEKAVEAISDKLGQWFYDAWDHAWVLHVWGFHEAKLDSNAVKRRLPYIEKMFEAAKRVIE